MFIALAVAAVFALGFGAGRVKHPANLKVSAVKAEIAKLEGEVKNYAIASKAIARLKALL
jgi:hypothetical protein